MRRLLWTIVAVFVAFAHRCDAAVYSDATYSSVLSTIPGITFVSSPPSMDDDTSVYFTTFAWPANRSAQQVDYVSVPVAAMPLCVAVQTSGAFNTTTTPTMAQIGTLLTGNFTGSSWLRSDWTATKRLSKIYVAPSSIPALLNALGVWVGTPFNASNTSFPSQVNDSIVNVLATDADVVAALVADPSAIALTPLIAALQAKMSCLSISRKTGPVATPQITTGSINQISFNATSLIATCPNNANCYPIVSLLVAHVRKRSSMTMSCNTSTSVMPVVFSFTSSTSPTVAPLGLWSMLFPPATTILLSLQRLVASVCMPETQVLTGAGSDLTSTPLNDWSYKYFVASNGTGFVNYRTMSSAVALTTLASGMADFAVGPALNVTNRLTHPTLHSFPTLATAVSIVVNTGLTGTIALPRCSVTSIFNGTIDHWNDDALQNANPLLKLPAQPISVGLRTYASPLTDAFMAGLDDDVCESICLVPRLLRELTLGRKELP